MVSSTIMAKPVSSPAFWMAKAIKALPFLSSSRLTSFISGNLLERESKVIYFWGRNYFMYFIVLIFFAQEAQVGVQISPSYFHNNLVRWARLRVTSTLSPRKISG